jgi:TDG/mug DNA glycosylase family protein
VLGVTVYRTAFGHPGAIVGPQAASLGPTRVWVLPNPSGLNASWTTPKLTEAYRDLRLHAEAEAVTPSGGAPAPGRPG